MRPRRPSRSQRSPICATRATSQDKGTVLLVAVPAARRSGKGTIKIMRLNREQLGFVPAHVFLRWRFVSNGSGEKYRCQNRRSHWKRPKDVGRQHRDHGCRRPCFYRQRRRRNRYIRVNSTHQSWLALISFTRLATNPLASPNNMSVLSM